MRALLLTLVLACPAAARDLPRAPTDADFAPVRTEAVALGRLLFWDKALSGNRDISCGTCHHPRYGTSDGLSLGLGAGGVGVGPARRADPANPPRRRMARNAPALWNLGAREFTVLFHDGRVEAGAEGLRTPLGDALPPGFAAPLAAQMIFPLLAPDEMAGHPGTNAISTAVRDGLATAEGGALDRIAARIAAIPDYRARFATLDPAFAEGRPIRAADIAAAIAAFIASEFRATDSPFDHYLRDGTPLPDAAARGLALFYGPAGCADCHAGPFLTDHRFHATGTPQIGPGKPAPIETHQRDTGRMRVTGRAADAYAFRTPSLRMVTLTGPWGHAGAHADLAAFLRHHADPVAGLAAPDLSPVLPPFDAARPDLALMAAPWEVAQIAAAVTRPPVALTEAGIADLIAFLGALADPAAAAGRLGIPETVPSGLPVDR